MSTLENWNILGLHTSLLKALKEFNFEFMMPVQKATIPMFMKNYDVAVEAQTGSGKTLSFLLPMFHVLL